MQLKHYDVSRPFAPRLHRVVTNVCINQANARSRLRASVDFGLPDDGGEAVTEGSDPDEMVLSQEVWDAVLDAIQTPDPKLRQDVILRVLEEMSFRELGETFGVPLATTSTWLRRALMQVRQKLGRLSEGPKVLRETFAEGRKECRISPSLIHSIFVWTHPARCALCIR